MQPVEIRKTLSDLSFLRSKSGGEIVRKVLTLIFLLGFLCNAAYIQAAENDRKKDIPETKNARHMIVPFLGYQELNNEQIGYSYSRTYYTRLDSFPIHIEKLDERSLNVPELGVAYRYSSPLRILKVELSISGIHDQVNFKYPVSFAAGSEGYNIKSNVFVSRTNTVVGGMGMLVELPPYNLKWFSPSLRVGGGYAWRDISVDGEYAWEEVDAPDADTIYMLRAGLDFTFWNKDNQFLIEGSGYYTHFIPANDELDPFSGLGWRISVFPLWGGNR